MNDHTLGSLMDAETLNRAIEVFVMESNLNKLADNHQISQNDFDMIIKAAIAMGANLSANFAYNYLKNFGGDQGKSIIDKLLSESINSIFKKE